MPPRRQPLTVERITTAAVAVADAGGLAQLSMRTVAKALGVEAMSLYHHLAGKQALLDALADRFFTEIVVPPPTEPWRQSMTIRAASLRDALRRHPWALGLIESRPTPGHGLLAHHNGVLACLRENGFSPQLATLAFSTIDSFVYGFVLTEISMPFDVGDGPADFVAANADVLAAETYPYLVDLIGVQLAEGDFHYGDEFAPGLAVILDGLERELAGPR